MDPGNVGIDDVLGQMSPFFFKHASAITPGDLCVFSKTTFTFSNRLTLSVYSIQFAGALSLTVCPGAPQVKFVIGRPEPKGPAPDFIVPQPTNTTTQLIDAFAAVGLSPAELVALLASHSAAGADDFSPPLAGYYTVIIYWTTRSLTNFQCSIRFHTCYFRQ